MQNTSNNNRWPPNLAQTWRDQPPLFEQGTTADPPCTWRSRYLDASGLWKARWPLVIWKDLERADNWISLFIYSIIGDINWKFLWHLTASKELSTETVNDALHIDTHDSLFPFCQFLLNLLGLVKEPQLGIELYFISRDWLKLGIGIIQIETLEHYPNRLSQRTVCRFQGYHQVRSSALAAQAFWAATLTLMPTLFGYKKRANHHRP